MGVKASGSGQSWCGREIMQKKVMLQHPRIARAASQPANHPKVREKNHSPKQLGGQKASGLKTCVYINIYIYMYMIFLYTHTLLLSFDKIHWSMRF